MSKKNKDDWNKFIGRLLTRKRSNRQYRIPRDYVEAVADRIHSVNPTLAILTNTLVDFYSVAFSHGYDRSESDRKFRREKQEKHINDEWNKIKDHIDDYIHNPNTK